MAREPIMRNLGPVHLQHCERQRYGNCLMFRMLRATLVSRLRRTPRHRWFFLRGLLRCRCRDEFARIWDSRANSIRGSHLSSTYRLASGHRTTCEGGLRLMLYAGHARCLTTLVRPGRIQSVWRVDRLSGLDSAPNRVIWLRGQLMGHGYL